KRFFTLYDRFQRGAARLFVQITVWNSLVMEAARMEFERANLEIDGPIAVLRMNDPDVLNALSPGMIKGMSDALDFLAAAETPVRCLVLTGTGRAFSTGANLQGRAKDGITRGAPDKRWGPCFILSSAISAICPA